jgi:thiol:disulfide interchange protein DsbA
LISTRTILAAVLLGLIATGASAQSVPGRDYRVLDPPQRTLTPGKLEIIEFFSYGCPRCAELQPPLRTWIAKLPRDVVFRRVATGFGHTAWTNLAKTYYALDATGDLAKLDGALFHAIRSEHQPLFEEKSITAWVGNQGVDPQKFATAFASFGVNTQLNQAEEMVQSYKIDQLPALAINGKYVIAGQSFETMLARANELMVRIRAENKTVAPVGTP